MVNTINNQLVAVSPQLTDYVLAWQGAQSPPTRKMTLSQLYASPTLTGTPIAPTAAPGTNTTQLATTAFTAAAILAANRIAQVVNFESGAPATGTTLIPADNTIPQNTEGDQYLSLAITPTNAGSTLLIQVVAMASQTGTGSIAALFQDSTADALAAMTITAASGAAVQFSFVHKMTAATTSATTFKVRLGGVGAGTMTFNGSGGGGLLGGVMASSITITEVLP